MISPDERESDWAHEVTGEVAHVEHDGRISIIVNDIPIQINLQSSMEASELRVELLGRGDDVIVFLKRFELEPRSNVDTALEALAEDDE